MYNKWIIAYPVVGPPFIRSNTCAGFNNCLNFRNIFIPCKPMYKYKVLISSYYYYTNNI